MMNRLSTHLALSVELYPFCTGNPKLRTHLLRSVSFSSDMIDLIDHIHKFNGLIFGLSIYINILYRSCISLAVLNHDHHDNNSVMDDHHSYSLNPSTNHI